MAGKFQELPISGEPLAVESPMTNKKKKKSKKNKHTEEIHEVEVPQEVTNGVEEELSNKEKKKKRKREEKEIEKNKKKNVPEKKLEADDLSVSNGGESEQQKVVVTGKDVEEAKYTALKTFAESNLPENVLDCCKTFEKPSPIQSHTWPFLLDGRDLIGIAKTGSG